MSLRHRLEAAAFELALKGFSRLGAPQASFFGRRLGDVAWNALSSRRRVALQNLAQVYGPQMSASERRQIGRQSFRDLGMLVADFARLPTLTADQIDLTVSRGGDEGAWKLLQGPTPVLAFTGHLGSWELLPYCAALWGFPIHPVVRPADNPQLESVVRGLRERSGNRVIAKRGAAREMLKRLRAGENVGVLIDQSVSPRHGVPTMFLGQPTFSTGVVAQLARRTGAAVIPAFIRREPEGWRHTIVFEAPLELLSTSDADHDIRVNTERCLARLEAQVRERPGQWLWCHRRWRHEAEALRAIEQVASP